MDAGEQIVLNGLVFFLTTASLANYVFAEENYPLANHRID
jgi:hypothetical protein